MRRSATFLAVAIFSAFVAAFLGNPASFAASGNCEGKLVGNAYDCNVNDSEFGDDASGCFEFFPGSISVHFDMLYAPGGNYGCTCLAKGSVKSPSFDASANAFECVETNGDYQFGGKVKGNKLSGQGSSTDGASDLFTCTKRSSPCP